MITQAYVAEMAAFNKWQNDKLFDLCDDLGDADRRADRGMFFGSIHHTLDHICMVTRALLCYLNGTAPPGSAYGDILWPDWQELRHFCQAQDQDLIDCARQWSDDWMAEVIPIHMLSQGRDRQMPRWILITQIFNHATHHRSQITAELHRMGIAYGSTSIPFRPGAGYFVD